MKGSARRMEFEYDTLYLSIRALMIAMLFIFAIALFGTQAGSYIPFFIFLIGLFAFMILVFGISPLLTRHWLTASRLILRKGLYFKVIIPLRDVSSIEPYDGEARMGTTISLSSRILFVTSAKFDLVQIRLKRPRRFLSVFGLKADRIVFNVKKRDVFLASAAERLASLSPIKTKGSDS